MNRALALPNALPLLSLDLWKSAGQAGRQAGSVVVVGRAGYYEMTMMTTRPETLLPPLRRLMSLFLNRRRRRDFLGWPTISNQLNLAVRCSQ